MSASLGVVSVFARERECVCMCECVYVQQSVRKDVRFWSEWVGVCERERDRETGKERES
jgi:hypothetical protein